MERLTNSDKEIPTLENNAEYWLKVYFKLKDIEDAEKQGLRLRLPCKVGDTVYFLDRFCGGYASDCPSRPCENCPDYQLEIYEGNFMLNNICDFGKTVFLTREEAEAKLKEMEGSHDGE